MDDILDVIKSRKSIRRYKEDPLPDEVLDKILESARWAPSGENEQPWKLIVVRDPEIRKEIGEIARIGTGQRMTAEYCMGKLQPRFEGMEDVEKRESLMKFLCTGEVSVFPAKAPVVIVVLGSLHGMFDTPYDLSACIENMLLEAHSLGVGACWVHGPAVYPRMVDKLKRLLKIPAGMGEYKVLSIVSFGWPLEARKYPRPKKSLDEIVYWEEFGRTERH
jgi:nitroreductase